MSPIAKCGCAGTTCGCKISGSASVAVAGTGTAQDPYVITLGTLNIAPNIAVDDSASVDFTLTGTGTAVDPTRITAVIKVGANIVVTAANGGTTVVDEGTRQVLFDHVATIAGHTITLPATSTALEKEILFIAASAITALTVGADGGNTVSGMPTTLAAGGYFRARLIGTVWRRVG